MNGSIKTTERNHLFDYYKKNGYKEFLVYANERRGKLNPNKWEDAHRSGEIGEAVLFISLLEYKKRYPEKTKGWTIVHSLIVKSEQNKAHFTEIDTLLITPTIIVFFEVKSYRGDKKLTGKGTVKAKSKTDVYQQNLMHVDTVKSQLLNFLYPNKKPRFGMGLFIFAPGTIKDERDLEYRRKFPLITIQNLGKFLDSLPNDEVNWSVSHITKFCKLLKIRHEGNEKEHMKYLEELEARRTNE